MTYQSNVAANTAFAVLAGNCLAMAQGIVGAPVMYNSATDAANATKFRHYDRYIPDSICVLWFDHWGSYGYPGRETYANWGHVVVYIPGRGYASSSPIAGQVSTPYYYGSISEVERAFNCTYRFWSEDLNGLRVTQPTTTTDAAVKAAKRRSKNMLMAYCADAAGKGKGRWAVFGPNFWLEIESQESANALSGQLGVKAQVVGASAWEKYKRVSNGK